MKRMSRYWALPGAVGFALIVAAALLSSSSLSSPGIPGAQAQEPTPTNTAVPPTVTATPNPDCDIQVSKEVNATTIGEGGQATYTITVKNDADDGDCVDLEVTDIVPDHTNCVTASVTDTNDLDFDASDIQDTCDDNDTVEWLGDGDLAHGDQVVLKMVVELTSAADEGDHISNTACAVSDSDVGGDCDSVRFTVGTPATATPQPTATRQPTVQPPPTVIVPPPVAPTARVVATISPPVTGTGSSGGGSGPLALGLGLLGGVMLLVSGAALVKRAR